MIKDIKRQEAIFHKFPDVSPAIITEIKKKRLPQYVFYKTSGKKPVECYCAHCEQSYKVNFNNWYLRHKEEGFCHHCGCKVQFQAAGMGRKNLRARYNAAICKAVRGKMYIRCFLVEQSFDEHDKKDCAAYVNFEEKACYYLEPGAAQKWRYVWCWGAGPDLVSQNRETEPIFQQSAGFGFGVDNSYTVFGKEEIQKTFLKYSAYEKYSADTAASNFISYLCMYVKRPQIEYMVKAGYAELVKSIFTKSHGLKLNFRSNDLKKVLNLDSTEIKSLSGTTSGKYLRYQRLKKMMPEINTERRLELADLYDESAIDLLEKIHAVTGQSWEAIENYVGRQQKYKAYAKMSRWMILRDWRDYLDDCAKLEYNARNTRISKPRNLHKQHEETTKLVQIKASEEQNRKAKERAEKLKKLAFAAPELGLEIIMPQTAAEIIAEGKAQSHCVGSYVRRHVAGDCTIVFLRKISAPDKAYYTIELNGALTSIMQCRGYKNAGYADKPEVKAFLEMYRQYLESLGKKKEIHQRVQVAV